MLSSANKLIDVDVEPFSFHPQHRMKCICVVLCLRHMAAVRVSYMVLKVFVVWIN